MIIPIPEKKNPMEMLLSTTNTTKSAMPRKNATNVLTMSEKSLQIAPEKPDPWPSEYVFARDSRSSANSWACFLMRFSVDSDGMDFLEMSGRRIHRTK